MAEPAASRSCSDHAVHRSRAGRRSRPTCAQSAQGKAAGQTEKQMNLFFGWPPAFLMPGSSLDVIQVTGGNKFGFFRLLHRPLRSRRVWSARKMILWIIFSGKRAGRPRKILLAQRFGGRGGLQRFPFASFCFLCSILIRYQYHLLRFLCSVLDFPPQKLYTIGVSKGKLLCFFQEMRLE